MSEENKFYTLKGYSAMDGSDIITTAMEDYMEMIYRLAAENQVVRIKQLSQALHVKPSSASKMASILKEKGFIAFEKYGHISMTEEGIQFGKYLLYRHNLLHHFFCLLNKSDNELILVEKIEHFIDKRTVHNIQLWLDNNTL